MKRTMAKGIYRDAHGYEVRATVNGVTRLKRYPSDAQLRTMRAWQEDERAAIRRDRPKASRGTLAADAELYLRKVCDMPSVRTRTQHINWWVEQFGHRRRDSLKPGELQAAIDTMTHLRPSSYNAYRTALAHLWRTLDGPQAHNPVRMLSKRSDVPGAPRAIPDEAMDAIRAALHLDTTTSRSVARIYLMSETGFSPAMIKMLTPDDVNLVDGTVNAPARHKGAGISGRVLPLTAGGREAFTLFAKLNAWGAFSTNGLNATFKAAVEKAGYKHLGLSLYALRHTFLTRVMLATGGNLQVVQAMAQHASMTTTQRYTKAAVPTLLQQAVANMDGRVH